MTVSKEPSQPDSIAKNAAKVCIVDDDAAVRDSLEWLIESVNLPVKTFANGIEFLDSNAPFEPGCVILDIRMPGLSGIDVFEDFHGRSAAGDLGDQELHIHEYEYIFVTTSSSP